MTYWESAGPQIRRIAFWLLIAIAAGGMAYCAFVNSPAQAGGYGGEENGETPDPETPGETSSQEPECCADGPNTPPEGDSPNQERCEGHEISSNRFWKPATDPCPQSP